MKKTQYSSWRHLRCFAALALAAGARMRRAAHKENFEDGADAERAARHAGAGSSQCEGRRQAEPA